MKTADLHRALETALRDGAFADWPEQGRELRTLQLLLSDHPNLSLEDFCAKARKGMPKTKPAKQAQVPKGQGSEPAPSHQTTPLPDIAFTNKQVVDRYLGELEKTKADSRTFEVVVDRLKKDKSLSVEEAREIARRFMGSAQKFRSKPDVAKAILKRQIDDLRTAGKLKRVGDIF